MFATLDPQHQRLRNIYSKTYVLNKIFQIEDSSRPITLMLADNPVFVEKAARGL
jgi:hypothetical protein